MIEKFKDLYEKRHEYALDWKERTGGKVMGYFCTYVPEEILYAADVLPVRIFGSHQPQSVTEPYLFAMYCPFCRDCLAQGLEGKYDYLDGVMIAHSCIHIRQAYFSWEHHIPRELNYYLTMPHNLQTKAALPFLKREYENFVQALEEWVGRKLTNEDLDRGIEIMNQNRRLMRQIYESRKAPTPPISSLEAMYMVVSSQLIHKEEHSNILKEVLTSELKGRSVNNEEAVRLMIVGSENDDIEFVKMVESVGGRIVVDDHCTGTRYFWNEVIPQEDRLSAIAERYINRIPCPTKDWQPTRRRFQQIKDFIREFDVKGVILVQEKFCDPHELDFPFLRSILNEIDVKVLELEFDVTAPLGPFRIRVEAFLETLRGEELF